MKNMKKAILGIAILAIVLITMMGSVNAASITASAPSVEEEGKVTVTVSMDATSAVQFELPYNNKKFEFLGASAGDLGNDVGVANGGVVKVAAFATNGTATTKTVTLTFKALAPTEGEGATFTVNDLITESGEAIANPKVTVKVSEKVTVKPEEPDTPQNPSQPQPETPSTDEGNKGTTTTNSQKAEEKVGTNGKVIKKLPQTGTPVFIGVIAFIIVAGAVLVVKKIK